jgi:hypothetical protein
MIIQKEKEKKSVKIEEEKKNLFCFFPGSEFYSEAMEIIPLEMLP